MFKCTDAIPQAATIPSQASTCGTTVGEDWRLRWATSFILEFIILWDRSNPTLGANAKFREEQLLRLTNR
jgi:hypothetical protein